MLITKQSLKNQKETRSSKADIDMGNLILEPRQASMSDLMVKSWGILMYKEITSKETIL